MVILANGVDVSKHNGTIDWAKVKQTNKVDFAIIRAGYGNSKTQIDRQFESNYKNATTNGIPLGAYWYCYSTSTSGILNECKVFLDVIKGKKFSYPIWLDIEEKTQANLSSSVINDMVKNACEYLEAQGYYTGIYSYDSFFNKITHSNQIKFDQWVANTSSKPKTAESYGMHQYSFTGNINGITGAVDLDTAYIDYPTIIVEKGLNGYTANSSVETVTATTSTATTVTHTVAKGDTLSAIAKKYNTTVGNIVLANKDKYSKITANYIQIGWILTIK